VINTRVLLAKRPAPKMDESCFRLELIPLAAPGPGEVVVRSRYLSCDPYLRLEMASERFALDQPIRARAAGVIETSADPAWPEGTRVWGFFDWADFSVVPTSALHRVSADTTLSQAIGAQGMNGLTAWVGALDFGRPQPADTVVVSSAVGSVGSIAGQLAHLAGARVVGIAGSEAKLRHAVDDLGYDAAVSYRGAHPLGEALTAACPNGIDVYFDNVGGAVLEAVLPLLRPQARLAMCGSISRYDDPSSTAPDLSRLMGSGATAQWFSVHHHLHRLPQVSAAIGRLLVDGALTYVETFVDGIEHAPTAFLQSLHGDHVGKVLVRIGDVN
jgi:NADPH-dependent curcumin reductase CurA